MFTNRLTTTLTLTIKGKKLVVPAGNLKQFRVELEPWGFRAEASFWHVSQAKESEDEIFAPFIKDDPIEASLKIDRTFDTVGESADPLVVSGWVESRRVLERAFEGLSGAPVLHRRYRITFRDPLAVKLDVHRPVGLYVNTTLKNLISKELPTGLSLTSKWKGATTTYPVLSVGLGADPGGASFRDFLFWLGTREGYEIAWDADKKTYTLDDTKPKAGKTEPIPIDDVDFVEAVFDEPPRFAIDVLNGAAEAKTRKKRVTNSRAYKGARQDDLLVTPIAKEVEGAAAAARERIKAPSPGLEVVFARFPSVTMRVGRIYDFSEDWSRRLSTDKKTFRLRSLVIDARAERQSATDDSDDDANTYELDVVAQFEDAKDKRLTAPPHVVPTYPFQLEGQVVSDVGKKDELTYQHHRDETKSLDYYLVKVPLFGLDVRAPFHPNTLSGHFYFPAYRDERVLLDLYLDGAAITRFLDWRPGARLPKESQGNHLLLGKKAEDQTSLRHVYEEAKPVLHIERTSGPDTQTIRVSEGRIRMETKEKKK